LDLNPRIDEVSSISVDFSGKVIAVTGAYGALGLSVCAALAGSGAQVARLDRAPVPPGSALGQLSFGGLDLADDAAAATAIEQIVLKTGRLDGLINIAGGFHFEKLEQGTLDTWDSMYRMNLRSAVACCKAALPHLLKSGNGRIINVGALGAVKASAGMGAYAASKAGVAKLTEALADELKDRGVTVNALLPSTIDTPRNRLDMPKADFSSWVAPAAIGEVVAFLMSDSAGAVTGALIPVTGRT
jgi:NAD(P)-dependent dehydrogenase (short-subunit alcohol dehydrogenase family)